MLLHGSAVQTHVGPQESLASLRSPCSSWSSPRQSSQQTGWRQSKKQEPEPWILHRTGTVGAGSEPSTPSSCPLLLIQQQKQNHSETWACLTSQPAWMIPADAGTFMLTVSQNIFYKLAEEMAFFPTWVSGLNIDAQTGRCFQFMHPRELNACWPGESSRCCAWQNHWFQWQLIEMLWLPLEILISCQVPSNVRNPRPFAEARRKASVWWLSPAWHIKKQAKKKPHTSKRKSMLTS